jgi:hypothetical protein
MAGCANLIEQPSQTIRDARIDFEIFRDQMEWEGATTRRPYEPWKVSADLVIECGSFSWKLTNLEKSERRRRFQSSFQGAGQSAPRTPPSGAVMKDNLPTRLAVLALAFACGPAQAAFGELVWWRI